MHRGGSSILAAQGSRRVGQAPRWPAPESGCGVRCLMRAAWQGSQRERRERSWTSEAEKVQGRRQERMRSFPSLCGLQSGLRPDGGRRPTNMASNARPGASQASVEDCGQRCAKRQQGRPAPNVMASAGTASGGCRRVSSSDALWRPLNGASTVPVQSLRQAHLSKGGSLTREKPPTKSDGKASGRLRRPERVTEAEPRRIDKSRKSRFVSATCDPTGDAHH
jgi:hypothetical protein